MSTLHIKTRGSSNDIGQMECYWDIDAALDYITRQFERLPKGVLETIRRMSTTPLASLDEALLEEENITISRAKELFLELAPDAFFQAQWQLIVDIHLILCQEFEVNVITPDGEVSFKPAGRELIHEERESIQQFFRRLHNSRMGIVPGRPPDSLQQHEVSYYETILRKLREVKRKVKSDGVGLPWLNNQEEYSALNKHPDLVARLFKPGRESEPARIAREYTIREFQFNLSENALELKLRRRKTSK